MPAGTIKIEFEGGAGKLAAALEMPARAPRAFALFAHCFSCTKDIKAAREVSRALRGEGIAVLRFDFTGLGASEGDFSNTNFSSNVEDLVRAADFLRREFSAPALLVGHSLGGAAMLAAAPHIPETKAVAAIGAPAQASHVLAHIGEARATIEREGRAEVQLGGRPFTIKKQLLDDLEKHVVLDAAAALKKPFLIMHAPRDAVVGVENATKLFMAARHPKSFVSLDDADHLLSNAEDACYAGRVLAAWASRYIGDKQEETDARTAPFLGGARAEIVSRSARAVALSIDGHPFISDVRADEGGDDLGPNPTRILEAALAACATITMRMYAERKGWPLTEASIGVRRAPGEDSHAAYVLEKTVAIGGDLDAAQRERLREIADKCPVHRMLTQGVKIASRLE